MNKPNRSKYGLTIEIMKNCISKIQAAEVEKDKNNKKNYCMIFLKRHKWNGHLNTSIMDPLSDDRAKDQVKEVCRRDDIRTTQKKEMRSIKCCLCTSLRFVFFLFSFSLSSYFFDFNSSFFSIRSIFSRRMRSEEINFID